MALTELAKIVSAGFYDASYYIKKKESDNRKTYLFEVELPVSSGGISYIDDLSENIEPGLVICAKPGQTRHTRPPFKCYYVHLLLESGTAYDVLSSAPSFFGVDAGTYEKLRTVFSEICRYNDTGVARDELKAQSLLLELIYIVGEESEKLLRSGKNAGKKETDATIIRAIEYIDRNFTEISGLSEIAEYVHLSPVYFQGKFRAATGVTPHDYLLDKKIKTAADMLLTTDYSLSRIAYECGFSSQSYFSYIFKKRMNATPREYMRSVYNKYKNP